MEYKRKFVIQVFYNEELIGYISRLYKLELGYNYILTFKTKQAKIWKLEKTCLNAIDRIERNIDPTKLKIKNTKLKPLEITDNQILREIKLKKLSK